MTTPLFTTESEKEWIRELTYRPRVLLIDDEALIIKSISILATGYAMHLQAAMNGVDGANAFENGKFDGVLLDLRLPDVDGVEVFKRIRTLSREVPVGIISGYITQEAITEMIQYGRFTLMPKPFDDRLSDLKSWFKALGIREITRELK